MAIEKIFTYRVGHGTREKEVAPLLPSRVAKRTLVIAHRALHEMWRKVVPDIALMSPMAYVNGGSTRGFDTLVVDECHRPTWDKVLERAKGEVMPVWVINQASPQDLWEGRLKKPEKEPSWADQLPAEVLERMRAIRLYHWREMNSLRNRSLLSGTYKGTQAELAVAFACNKAANIHLGFVQALNDLFPVDDTAERDDAFHREATAGNGE